MTKHTPWGYDSVMKQSAKKSIEHRLSIIEGQIRGIQEMVDKEKYCVDIITQTSAVKRALSGIEDALMENHLNTCVVHQMKKGKENMAIKEIIKVYGLKRK